MINKLLRIVLSAHDAGSAGHIGALAVNAALHGMDSLIVAEGAAHIYFKARHIPHVPANAWLASLSTAENSKSNLTLAGEKLTQFGACAVVCGRSSLEGKGIDRTVISAARQIGIPSFVFQDFWGDIWTEDQRPDHYLVLDEVAAQLTREKTCAEVHVIGSPKHVQFLNIDFLDLRQKGRFALGLSADMPTIGYFGQDLHNVPGYGQVLLDVGESVGRLKGVKLFYKPHPLETKFSQLRSLKFFQNSGVDPLVVHNFSAETSIAAADVVLSCFSTVSLDAAFMMAVNKHAKVSIVCADYPESISNFWRPATGLAEFPLITKGIALAASDKLSLENALHLGLTPTERNRQALACQLKLSNPYESVERTLKLISSVINKTTINVRAKF